MIAQSMRELMEESSSSNRYELDVIKKVAEENRFWAEDYAEKNHFPKNLCGLCAIASAQLWHKFANLGVVSELRVWGSSGDWCAPGSSHVYLVVHDHVVDITAGQFRDSGHRGIPDVYIAHEHEASAVYNFYQHLAVMKNPKELYAYQHRCNWMVHERAKTHEIKFY